MHRSHAREARRRSTGASLVEAIIVVGLVALAGLVAFKKFGTSTYSKIRTFGDNVTTLTPTQGGSSYCFAAGTLVATPGGLRAIETIAVGDEVFSQSEGGNTRLSRVAQTFVTPDAPVLAVHFVESPEAIVATPGHRFYSRARGWVEAQWLTSGEEIADIAGSALHVRSVEALAEHATVYNFEVEETHTYFVGSAGAWVHNPPNTNTDCNGGAIPSLDQIPGSSTAPAPAPSSFTDQCTSDSPHAVTVFNQYSAHVYTNNQADLETCKTKNSAGYQNFQNSVKTASDNGKAAIKGASTVEGKQAACDAYVQALNDATEQLKQCAEDWRAQVASAQNASAEYGSSTPYPQTGPNAFLDNHQGKHVNGGWYGYNGGKGSLFFQQYVTQGQNNQPLLNDLWSNRPQDLIPAPPNASLPPPGSHQNTSVDVIYQVQDSSGRPTNIGKYDGNQQTSWVRMQATYNADAQIWTWHAYPIGPNQVYGNVPQVVIKR